MSGHNACASPRPGFVPGSQFPAPGLCTEPVQVAGGFLYRDDDGEISLEGTVALVTGVGPTLAAASRWPWPGTAARSLATTWTRRRSKHVSPGSSGTAARRWPRPAT